MHVTSYTTFMYVIDFTRALNFGEAQGLVLSTIVLSHVVVNASIGF